MKWACLQLVDSNIEDNQKEACNRTSFNNIYELWKPLKFKLKMTFFFQEHYFYLPWSRETFDKGTFYLPSSYCSLSKGEPDAQNLFAINLINNIEENYEKRSEST